VQPSTAAHGPPARSASTALKETTMTWETPTAIDFRFGFEITMYVTAR
jgi:coenzyme PQQ precursor peptide PqqA